MVRAWGSYEKEDRDRLGLAIRRLASSLSRTGRFRIEDRILDIAIALEIMYGLDDPEITYKLRTRAAYLLGTSPEERVEIFDKIGNFYGGRSATVHGSRGRRQQIDPEEALADGLGIARRTTLALLRYGGVPNWNRLVLAGGGDMNDDLG